MYFELILFMNEPWQLKRQDKNRLRERENGAKGRRVREEEVMIGLVEVGSCEKDLRLVVKEFHRRVEELQKTPS